MDGAGGGPRVWPGRYRHAARMEKRRPAHSHKRTSPGRGRTLGARSGISRVLRRRSAVAEAAGPDRSAPYMAGNLSRTHPYLSRRLLALHGFRIAHRRSDVRHAMEFPAIAVSRPSFGRIDADDIRAANLLDHVSPRHPALADFDRRFSVCGRRCFAQPPPFPRRPMFRADRTLRQTARHRFARLLHLLLLVLRAAHRHGRALERRTFGDQPDALP